MRRESHTMQSVFLSLLVSVLIIGSAHAEDLTSERSATADEKEILNIEHDRIRIAAIGGSVGADWWDQMEDDGIALIFADGTVITKAQHVAEWRTGGFKALFMDLYDYHVRIYNGNTAVVTYLAWAMSGMGLKTISLDNPHMGDKNTVKYLNSYHHGALTDVFVKEAGKWRMVVHQVSPIHEASDSLKAQ